MSDLQFKKPVANASVSKSNTSALDAAWDQFPEHELGTDTAVSEAEMEELVCRSWADAVRAMTQSCPETFLDISACEKRARLAEKLEALPKVQLMHPLVQAEAGRQLAFIAEQTVLAKAMVQSGLNYGHNKDRRFEIVTN